MDRIRARAERGAHEDGCGDCPMCVAERSGRPLAVTDFVPRPDGGPPPIYDGAEGYLVKEAKKALATADLQPGESLPFIHMGSRREDGTLATASFSVESDGAIYWTSPSKRILVARVGSCATLQGWRVV